MTTTALQAEKTTGAKLIDGKAVALKMRATQRARVEALQAKGITPGLAVVLVGDDPASAIYVSRKVKACEAVGIKSVSYRHPTTITNEELLVLIGKLNADPNIHGILVQLPLPAHIDMAKVLETIAPEKDVDGFHLYNVGALVVGRQIFPPCTPYGVMHLLEYSDIPVEGRNVVVVGASNIVGKPMALMLMARDATVAICHAKTRDLGQWTILADILVVAAGVPNLIVPQMVKTDAVVIDVGINRLPDGRIVGDVDFEGVRKKASYITPVPGGVGPMTIAMLLENTIQSAERQASGEPA
ncbi:MAG: bifunctional methylenetetrahydrofolate dehydrogenase/methenyltetrahydrofolate cyclohydrolase FolD [Sphingomonas sp.]|nr:bifunctional methylenetetrahydrofolate dehydrogenase/methenyltetrahydrofolate cyclohydrolase FolD [Sphingomonas sp.]